MKRIVALILIVAGCGSAENEEIVKHVQPYSEEEVLAFVREINADPEWTARLQDRTIRITVRDRELGESDASLICDPTLEEDGLHSKPWQAMAAGYSIALVNGDGETEIEFTPSVCREFGMVPQSPWEPH